MMQWLYLMGLLVSIAGMMTLDWRYKLALFYDRRRALLTIVAGMLVFIVWDILGISQGIFFHGGSPYTLPIRILPEFPVEEIFFLFLLCYVTLVLYRTGERLWPRI